jgi:hypothetical protein
MNGLGLMKQEKSSWLCIRATGGGNDLYNLYVVVFPLSLRDLFCIGIRKTFERLSPSGKTDHFGIWALWTMLLSRFKMIPYRLLKNKPSSIQMKGHGRQMGMWDYSFKQIHEFLRNHASCAKKTSVANLWFLWRNHKTLTLLNLKD